MEATLRFAEQISGAAPARLDECALLIAKHGRPDLDVEAELARIDELAAGCSEPTLDGVARLLFRDLGFDGDHRTYHDPANSFLDRVIDRRVGLPITLSVLMIEVGRRLGVPLDPVAMPGHFLVRDRVLADVFLDPFHGGRRLDIDGARRRFHVVMGARTPFHPRYLEPVTPEVVLTRMVANLVGAYQRNGDIVGLGWACRLRALCPGLTNGDRVELARWLAVSGQYGMAASLHDEIARQEPAQADEHEAAAVRLRARLN